MKIVFFLENIQCGGVDTFCENLVNFWPNSDQIIFVCNKSHPGFVNIKNNINKECSFYAHKIPISWNLLNKIPFVPYRFLRIFGPLLRLLLLPIQFYKIRNLLDSYKANALISISGGYPGGETSRIASIVWGQMGKKCNIYNFHNFAQKPRFGLGWYESIMDKALARHVDLFISVSKVCVESLRERKAFSLLKNLTYIHNGVSFQNENKNIINIHSMFDIPEDAFICLMLSTYEKRKGHEFIFRAFEIASKLNDDMHLVICGGGSQDEIRSVEILRKKIVPDHNVHLARFIPNGSELIKQSDILLIGSQELESFGLTAIEAMQFKVPVIATNVGGLPEVIGRSGISGFLVEKDDYMNFAVKIKELYKNRSLYEKITLNAKLRYENKFRPERMAKKYMEYLIELNKDEYENY